MMSSSTSQVYTIQGFVVHFPYKAYASQIAMMDKILAGLKRGQNCLLESPTGSGKSLALLCASLAWLQHIKAEMIEQEKSEMDALERESDKCNSVCECHSASGPSDDNASVVCGNTSVVNVTQSSEEYNDDDDFVDPKKKFGFTPRQVPKTPAPIPDSNYSSTATSIPTAQPQQPKHRVLPKIYFGTRTHKQIAQLIRELAKTDYADVKIDILGSRDHTCVHPHVSKSSNKNEMCQMLVHPHKGEGCGYYNNATKVHSYGAIRNFGLRTAWDLEDLVSVGKKFRVCPYYLTRTLKDMSEIIFCPYNYIIDPLIRNNMEINLKGDVLVLDEAHNMEDCARSASSFSLSDVELKAAIDDMDNVANYGYLPSTHRAIGVKLGQLMDWILKQDAVLTGSEDPNKTWTGVSFVAILAHLGLGSEDYDEFTRMIHEVRGVDAVDTKAKEEMEVELSSATSMLLSGFCLVLGYLFKNKFEYLDDYRIVVSKSFGEAKQSPATPHGWVSSQRSKTWIYSLKFWCLNPAVAFSDIRDSVHNIVLTSGTLSPMTTFESELNVPFKIKFEANHVINASQVWIGTIAQSDGVVLNGSFRNTESFAYQDAIGDLVLRVCQITPHGVLCFFPSYKLLQKLSTRWQDTGMWSRISQHKTLLSEPRSNYNNEFENTLKEFYTAIEESSKTQTGGSLLLAVCRGKVSEGLDFSDNNARAVITIGIPFSNIGAIDVNLKRNYNDAHFRKRNLLTGAQWYEIQAFRALNQALGRCIRHRNDWGALILVDDRFNKGAKYVNSLSKWVRKGLNNYPMCKNALTSLETFMKRRSEERPLTDISAIDTPKRATFTQPIKPNQQMTLKLNTPQTSASNSQLRVLRQTQIQSLPQLFKLRTTPNTSKNTTPTSPQINFPVFHEIQTPTSSNVIMAKDESGKNRGNILKRHLFKQEVKEEQEVELNDDERDSISPILFDDYAYDKILKRKNEDGCGDKQCKRSLREVVINDNDLMQRKIVCAKCRTELLERTKEDNFRTNGPVALEPYLTPDSHYIVSNCTEVSIEPLDTSNQVLNALYNGDDGCCFQLQVCSNCHQLTAFKVLSSQINSDFAVGQEVARTCSRRLLAIGHSEGSDITPCLSIKLSYTSSPSYMG